MNKKNNKQNNKENDLDKPDPETLHTTDPQDHMEGPVSSLVQDAKKMGEKISSGNKKDKDKKSRM
jgi:hypothetical protein